MNTNECHRCDCAGIKSARRVLIIGANVVGQNLISQMQERPDLGMLPVGLIDNDLQKRGQTIHGVPVVGNLHLLSGIAESLNINKIIIALPEATGPNIRQILAISKDANLPVGIISGSSEMSDAGTQNWRIRDVQIEDLLRNEPIQIDDDGLRRRVSRKRLLVTGAGGSIGSELCRQLAQYDPAELALLGHGEHSIFTLASEFARLHPQLPVVRLIADVRDTNRLQRTFETFRPDIVFHAAAHKHVSLMEDNVEDAVTNNVLGTRNVIKASMAHGVEKFILISTDKAVNPTSVMGATKRIAELLVSEAARVSGRCYLSVRFGNVLSSRGSVLSIFREQIARGGPVTVTHPEMRRYFMTIEEAVNLVLQSMLLGRGGEIFVLDMGEPLKIADLARDLIDLAGLKVGRDIDLEFTGMQPGEKLSEELFLRRGHYERTEYEKIFVSFDGNGVEPEQESCGNRAFDEDLDKQIDALVDAARTGERPRILQQLKRIVPEYQIDNGMATAPALLEMS